MGKRKLSDIGMAIFYILLDFTLFFFAINNYINTAQITEAELSHDSGVIVNKWYDSGSGKGDTREIILEVNYEKYVIFHQGAEREEFEAFYETIEAGDIVNLTYRSGYHKFLYRNEVVDLTINGKQLRTLDEHNAYNEGSEAFYIGALVVLIIANVFVFVIYLLLFNKKIQKLISDAEKKKRRARYR